MKNKKDFFGVLFSVLISVLLVGFAVYAVTTVGNNVSVGGTIAVGTTNQSTELSVVGTASISQDLWASGSFQFGAGEGQATASYSRLGSANTTHSLADADDLLITGLLEVDDAVYFDSTASISTSLKVPTIYGNTDAGEYLRIGDQALTSHSFNTDDDLLVTGRLEVDGIAYFDGVVSVSDANGLMIGGGAKIFGGTASPQGSASNPNCTAGSIYIRAGGAIDTLMARCEVDNSWNYLDFTDK